MDFDKFKFIVDSIRSRCNVVINLTSACFATSIADRLRPFAELKPEMASLDAGTMNWGMKEFLIIPLSFLMQHPEDA